MSTLDDFMAFNFCEDEREQQEAHQTTEYPYQSQFWDSSANSETEKSSYWDDDSSSDDY